MQVPLTRSSSFPHKFDGIFGAAKVMLRPAAEGTGVIAGEGSGLTTPALICHKVQEYKFQDLCATITAEVPCGWQRGRCVDCIACERWPCWSWPASRMP